MAASLMLLPYIPSVLSSTTSAAVALSSSVAAYQQLNRVSDTACSVLLRITGGSYLSDNDYLSFADCQSLQLIQLNNNSIEEGVQKLKKNDTNFISKTSSHPLLKELERLDFFCEVLLTKLLLEDLKSKYGKNEKLFNDIPQHSFKLSLNLLEETLSEFYTIIKGIEHEQQNHLHKWFYQWRKVNIGHYINKLITLTDKLKSRKQNFIELCQLWKLFNNNT